MTRAEIKAICAQARALIEDGAKDFPSAKPFLDQFTDPAVALLEVWLAGRERKRRERIATAALVGLLSYTPFTPEWASKESIGHADALIAELDKDGKAAG